MSRGFSSLGKKPASANTGNYAKSYARSKKLHGPRHDGGSPPPRVKLLLSTKPIPAERSKRDPGTTGFGYVFGITLVMGVALLVALIVLS